MRKILAVALVLVPAVAQADGSLGVRAGTLGLGLEFSYPISQRIGVRLNADSYKYTRNFNDSDIAYDAKATLKTGSVLFDWYPFANNFRISAGPMYNGNKLGLTGKPTGGTYTIDGTTYQASDVGTLNGDVAFKKYVPYAGIGYGRPVGSGFSLTFDFGVVFQQSPQATLTATCGPTATPVVCAQLQSDVASQQQTANDDLKNFRYYPVITLGLAYTF